MKSCPITLVFTKAIHRIFLILFDHIAIPLYFGTDRGNPDLFDLVITFDHCPYRDAE